MGVRIDVIRRAVGGPARVPNANGSLGKVLPDVVGQINDFSLLFFDAQGTPIFQRSDSSTVVPAVLQPFKSFD